MTKPLDIQTGAPFDPVAPTKKSETKWHEWLDLVWNAPPWVNGVDLSGPTRFVLFALVRYVDKDSGESFVGLDKLRRNCCMSDSTMDRAIKELKKAKLLSTWHRFDPKTRTSQTDWKKIHRDVLEEKTRSWQVDWKFYYPAIGELKTQPGLWFDQSDPKQAEQFRDNLLAITPVPLKFEFKEAPDLNGKKTVTFSVKLENPDRDKKKIPKQWTAQEEEEIT